MGKEAGRKKITPDKLKREFWDYIFLNKKSD